MRARGFESKAGLFNLGWAGLAALGLFTLGAVAGYWVFALHPDLIPDTDLARRVYGASFPYFARVHILLAALVLVQFLVARIRLRWFPAFLAVSLAAFASEHLGTGYGFPFSGYEYTGLLGPRLGGRVPLLIPLSWFLMVLPSWALARKLFSTEKERLGRILLGAYLLTAWDLALDPAMSYLTPYWVWDNPGPFYGMPLVNLAGWMGTGMVLMGLLEALGAMEWGKRLDPRWLGAYYGLVLLMPLGMLAAAGLWPAIGATLLALAAGPSLGWMVARRHRTWTGAGALQRQVGQ